MGGSRPSQRKSIVRPSLKRDIVPLLHGHAPRGRVTWQSACDDENSLSRLEVRASATSCSRAVKKNKSPLITSPAARNCARSAKAVSKSRSVLAATTVILAWHQRDIGIRRRKPRTTEYVHRYAQLPSGWMT